MGIKDTLINALFGGVIETRVTERLQAAAISVDENYGWRLLTSNDARQLPMMNQERQNQVAYWLYKTNPMAEWLINCLTAFVTADGMPITCEVDEVKELLQNFWDRNRLALRWENYVAEQGVFGNLCLSAHVAEHTGRVKLGYIDPGLISTTITDPEDVQTKIGVVIAATATMPQRTLAIILDRDTEEDLSPTAKLMREEMTDGRCFFFPVNCMSSELLGMSDLFTIADHLEVYEQFIFDSGEKWAQFNSFWTDVTVDGADNKKLEEERKLYTPPRSGGAFIHNEKVKMEAVSPDLKAADADQAARLHRNHVLGSKSFPEHWFGGGGDVNRATAAEMDRPTLKMLEKRQKLVKDMLKTIFDFVIQCALGARYLNVPEEDAWKYEISTPPLSDKDVAKLSTMLRDVSTSLIAAQTQGWIDQRQAAKMFAFCCGMLGFDYDPAEGSDIPPEGADYRDAKFAPQAGDDPQGAAIPRVGFEKQP